MTVAHVQKIVTNLWFDTESEEAANYYTSLFNNSRIVKTLHFSEAGPRPAGMVLLVTFELEGQQFTAINGGPEFKFNEAMSLQVNCDSQEEVDGLWDKLTEGGEKGQCGWLKDRFGVSWQITPTILEEMLADEDPAKANSVMKCMLQMTKIEIADLEKAYADPQLV
jgi:predicted 3-demethylubiquinone-9 3-methyltransferase (glyoxalase superfamily)